jgi:hypothetical protein
LKKFLVTAGIGGHIMGVLAQDYGNAVTGDKVMIIIDDHNSNMIRIIKYMGYEGDDEEEEWDPDLDIWEDIDEFEVMVVPPEIVRSKGKMN